MANENQDYQEDDSQPEGQPEAQPEDQVDQDGQADVEWLMSAATHQNIAELLEDEELATFGAKVVKEYEIDKGSRGDWDERMSDAMDLALQVVKEKTFPWPNAANVKFPLLTNASMQFAARAYPALIPGVNIVKCKVNGADGGGDKSDRAARIGNHMSWQLTEEMEEWEPDTDRMLHILPITGVAFRKSWYDSNKGRNTSQMVLPKHLFVDYAAESLETAPRITQEFELYPYQIIERVRGGMYLDHEYGVVSEGGDDEESPHVFLEQHRLLDLDEDGYPEPYIVTVHKDTNQVARIVARFEPEDVTVNDKGEVVRIEATQYFTKYGFIPNPESAIYDLGFGMLLGPINETVNTILNQMLDAGTLQNAGGGFIGKGLNLKGGTLKFRPGEYKRIDASGQKIADSVYNMQHSGPSPVLFNLLGLLIDAGKDVASIQDVLTGEGAGANASPTTTLAMIEQGLKSFSAIIKRIHRSLRGELKKIYRLNRLYLPPETYFTLLDEQEAISYEDYNEEDLDVIPVSDPNVVTDMQKVAKAEILLKFIGDPFFNQMEIRHRFLEAVGEERIDELLTEPPQQGPDPKDELDKMRVELEAMLQHAKLPAEIAETMSKAIKNIADAEAAEAGQQLQAYQVFVQEMIDGNSGGLPGMAQQPDNQVLPQVPQG